MSLAMIYHAIEQERFENIVFIGGHMKRETALWTTNTIYINPPISTSDKVNNSVILEAINILHRNKLPINIHLIQKKL